MIAPYYQDSAVTIYHGDCREILPTLPKVDLVLTDPPYPSLVGGYRYKFDGVTKRVRESVSVGLPWDSSIQWIDVVKSVCAKGMMIFCTHHSIPEIATACSDLRRVMLLTWYKRNSPPTGKNVPRFTTEFIWCFAKSVGLDWDNFDSTLIDIPNLQGGCMANERILNDDLSAAHPTQKPIDLLLHLMCVNPDTILDPFMGTGTTLRAAKDLGRKAIGIEIEERYCEIAARRMEQDVFTFNGREPMPVMTQEVLLHG